MSIGKLLLFHLLPGMVLFNPAISLPMPVISTMPTPTPIISPIEDARLAYVQKKLVDAGFPEIQVNQLLEDSRRTIYPAPSVAYRAPNWTPIKRKIYAASFVQRGKDFIAANQPVFDIAERDFGVPKEIVAGIIAIETEFGKNTGSTPTFNAIYSRLNHKKDTENWRLEAERLFALSRYCIQGNLDCYTIIGSYAGAIGIVQFMPDSMMKYGIDGDDSGLIDLQNPADAIPSAANFLVKHGWQENETLALTRYYGNPVGYPEIVLHYAELLKK